METTVSARLRQFREAKSLKQSPFAKKAGINQTTLSAIENGDSVPSYPILQKLFTAYPDLSAEWLLMGAGEMFKDGRTLTPAPATPKDTEKQEAAAAAESPAARPDTVRHADTVLKLASVEAENQQLRERLEDAKEEILWLRGKSRTSPDAAGPQNLAALPAPNAIGYHACAQRRAAEFDEYVAVRQEEGGVAELV